MKDFRVFVHLKELRVGAPFVSTGISGLSTGRSPALNNPDSIGSVCQCAGGCFEYLHGIDLITSVTSFEILFPRKPKQPV